MGCCDSVCSFSKIQVHTGDDIVGQHVFSGLENTSMAESRWGQIGLPIFGEYNDYGGIEKFDISHINYKILQETCEEMGSDEIRAMYRCQYRSDNPDLTEMFMKNVVCGEQMLSNYKTKGKYKISDINEKRYEIDISSGNFAHLCFIHREVYNHVVSVGAKFYEDKITPTDIDTYFDLRRSYIKEGKLFRINEELLGLEDNDNFTLDSFKNAEKVDHNTILAKVHHFILKPVHDCYPSMSNDTYNAVRNMTNELMQELSSEHPLVKTLIQNKYFRWGRMLLNLELVPHFSYAINQYRDNDDTRRIREFHRMSTKLATKLIRKEYDE